MPVYRRHDVAHTCPECGATVGASLIIPADAPDPVIRFPHRPDGTHAPDFVGDSFAARARRNSVPLVATRRKLDAGDDYGEPVESEL